MLKKIKGQQNIFISDNNSNRILIGINVAFIRTVVCSLVVFKNVTL